MVDLPQNYGGDLVSQIGGKGFRKRGFLNSKVYEILFLKHWSMVSGVTEANGVFKGK